MIHTITPSPSLDYFLFANQALSPDGIVRAEQSYFTAGGKGINVSRVLTRLGVPNAAIAPLGGFTGDRLESVAVSEGINLTRIPCGRETRVNVKIMGGGNEYAVNAASGALSPLARAEIGRMAFEKGDWVLVCGAVCTSDIDFWCDFLGGLYNRGVFTAVDSDGDFLRHSLLYNISLIKPNMEELRGLAGSGEITEQISRARALGAKNILLSQGADGATFCAENGEVFRAPASQLSTVNCQLSTVGGGDALLAGFLAEYAATGDAQKALIAANHTAALTLSSPRDPKARS